MTFLKTEIFLVFMVFIRAGAMISLIPMFGGRVVPRKMQISIALGMALVLFNLVPSQIPPPENIVAIFLAMFKELFIGVLMGFAVRMVFFIGELAGSLISTEASLMRSDSFDPLSEAHSTTVSSLFFYLSALLILASGTHYLILESFVASYIQVPIGAEFPSLKGVESFVRATAEIFLLGLKIAAPIVALSFVINVTFAVLGKAVPKMNVFVISFSVRILSGLSLVMLTIGLMIQYFDDYIRGIPVRMLEFLAY